ncbi:hypothetical protein AAIR98_000854 [Elusimicrobium simillimum]|uniref:hypothetical protein n=1 Tax=Elusimicrobium simillimum TaxID=3143438 RepID=UPI003C6F50A4
MTNKTQITITVKGEAGRDFFANYDGGDRKTEKTHTLEFNMAIDKIIVAIAKIDKTYEKGELIGGLRMCQARAALNAILPEVK